MSEVIKPYKYRIGFNQSVKGIFSIDGSAHFDDMNDLESVTNFLVQSIDKLEHKLKNAGKLIASDVPNDETDPTLKFSKKGNKK